MSIIPFAIEEETTPHYHETVSAIHELSRLDAVITELREVIHPLQVLEDRRDDHDHEQLLELKREMIYMMRVRYHILYKLGLKW